MKPLGIRFRKWLNIPPQNGRKSPALIDAFQNALAERTRERVPQEWALS